MCTQRHSVITSAPSIRSLSTQATPAIGPGVGDFGEGENPCFADQPRHDPRMACAAEVETVPGRALQCRRADKESQVVGSILGTRVLRAEDPGSSPPAAATSTTSASTATCHSPGPLSPTTSARRSPTEVITAIDTAEARTMPGVIAVFTAADLGLEPVPARFNPTIARPLLAADRVRFVGEPIAVIVAGQRHAAADAADTVIVDYDVLDAYIDPLAAIDGETLLFEAAAATSSSTARRWGCLGSATTTSSPAARSSCPGTSSTSGWPRARWSRRSAAAAWVDGRLYVWMSTQHAHGASRPDRQGQRPRRHRSAGRHAGRRRRFGAKITPYPEELLLGRLAKELGRPVAWAETRSESMTSLGHGRRQVHDVTIGGTRDGG